MPRSLFKSPRLEATVLAVTFVFTACSQPEGPRPPGAIAITGTTVVAELSAFGFGVSIDEATPIPMASSATMHHTSAGLAAGRHTVALRNLPSNCTSGSDSRTVELRGGDTVGVRFDIVCVRTTGDVAVKVVTTGLELDPDGYRLTVDNADRGSVGINTQLMLERLEPGTRTVAISGLANNCAVQGAVSRAIGVTAGSQLVVEFAIACRATRGTILLRNTRSGTDLDPDGVMFFINSSRVPMNVTSQLTLGAPVGQHTISVTDVADNCTLTGPVSTPVTLVGGDTVTVAVGENCVAIGAGVEGFAVEEPANDTLPNTTGMSARAIDVRRISGRYADGFVILTIRFSGNVASCSRGAANSFCGWLDLDVDENTNTGVDPGVNFYGGTAQQGVDFEVAFFGSDDVSARFLGADGSFGMVSATYDADSVTIRIPLSKIGRDDGNMTITGVIGTLDRPTDIVPNTGQILARRPTTAAVVGATALRDEAHAPGLVSAAKSAAIGVKFPRWPR